MSELRQYVTLLKKQKLRTMLRVYLSNHAGTNDIQEENWRALVQPGPSDDWNKWWRMWFEGYAKVIAIVGKIAESLGVNIYDLGVELNSTIGIRYYMFDDEDPTNPKDWEKEVPPKGPGEPKFPAGSLGACNGWELVIDEARKQFAGALTYSANDDRVKGLEGHEAPSAKNSDGFFVNSSGGKMCFSYPENKSKSGTFGWNNILAGGYKDVDFWHLLDYIGIDCYKGVYKTANDGHFPHIGYEWEEVLIGKEGSDVIAWNKHTCKNILGWLEANKASTGEKKVLLSEYGLRSYFEAQMNPQGSVDEETSVDFEAQAWYLSGTLQALEGHDWLAGAFIYHWGSLQEEDRCPLLAYQAGMTGETIEDMFEKYARGYPFVGKEAEVVIYALLWRIGYLLLP